MKADWYDLDFLFLSKNPGFRAWRVYENAVGFVNTYMDIFTADAFDKKGLILQTITVKREAI